MLWRITPGGGAKNRLAQAGQGAPRQFYMNFERYGRARKGRDQMTNITELALARKARGAIEKIGIRRRERTVEILRNASIAGRSATSPFSSDVALNEAREKVVISLTILIPALEAHMETLWEKNKAKAAIDDWIKELEAAKP
jgi:hypothetical protein